MTTLISRLQNRRYLITALTILLFSSEASAQPCCEELICEGVKIDENCRNVRACEGDPDYETICLKGAVDSYNDTGIEAVDLIPEEQTKTCGCVMLCDREKNTKTCSFGEFGGNPIAQGSVSTSDDCLNFCKKQDPSSCGGNSVTSVQMDPQCSDRVPIQPELPINTLPNYTFPGSNNQGTCYGITGLYAIMRMCPPVAENDVRMKYQDFLTRYLDVACGCSEQCPVPPLPRYVDGFPSNSFLENQVVDLTTSVGQQMLAAMIQTLNNSSSCNLTAPGPISSVEGRCRWVIVTPCTEGPHRDRHAILLCKNANGPLTVFDPNCAPAGSNPAVTPNFTPAGCDYLGALPPAGSTRCDEISYSCAGSSTGTQKWWGPIFQNFQSCKGLYPAPRRTRFDEATQTLTCDKHSIDFTCKKIKNEGGDSVWTCTYPKLNLKCDLQGVTDDSSVDCCNRDNKLVNCRPLT